MPHIYVLPDQQLVEIDEGQSILDAALDAGIEWSHACGGDAQCSTCRCVVIEGAGNLGDPPDDESFIIERVGLGPEFRLACQAIASGNVTIRRLVLDDRDIELTDARPRFARGPKPRSAPLRILGAPLRGFVRRRAIPRPVGEQRHVAVLFTDVRRFTEITEALLPYDIIHLLERHLRDVTDIVEAHRGRVTAYMGDGVMAVFGLEHPEGATIDAAASALAIIEQVERSREQVEWHYGRSFEVNAGVHAGEAIVGSLWGDTEHLTATGDVVNVAHRIEQANKEAGTRLLVSETAYRELGDIAVTGRTLSCPLPGKTGDHTLYEILDLEPRPASGDPALREG